jgi:hypothetical protein
MTTGPALALSIRLAENDMGRWSLVNSNALSICAQVSRAVACSGKMHGADPHLLALHRVPLPCYA